MAVLGLRLAAGQQQHRRAERRQRRDRSASAGGESGYIAVDPRNDNIIYAGNYGGTIQRTDRYSGVSESVRVYADEETGQRAADMKYRFQWNAPIRMSPHNPDVGLHDVAVRAPHAPTAGRPGT